MHLILQPPAALPGPGDGGDASSITTPQFRSGMGLAQPGENLLQGVQIVGDGAVGAGFAAPAFGQGDGDVLRVDIESDEE